MRKCVLLLLLLLMAASTGGCLGDIPKRFPESLQADWPSQDAALIKATTGPAHTVGVHYIDGHYVNAESFRPHLLVRPGHHKLDLLFVTYRTGNRTTCRGIIENDFIGGHTYRVDATADGKTVRFYMVDITK